MNLMDSNQQPACSYACCTHCAPLCIGKAAGHPIPCTHVPCVDQPQLHSAGWTGRPRP